jgi:hypothetical protein
VLDYGNILPVGFQTAGDLNFKYNYVKDSIGDTTSVAAAPVVFINAVPEPASLGLLALAGAGLRRRRASARPGPKRRGVGRL